MQEMKNLKLSHGLRYFPGFCHSRCPYEKEHYVFIGEVSIHIFCPFLNMIVCFVCVEFEEFFIDPGYQPFICTVDFQLARLSCFSL